MVLFVLTTILSSSTAALPRMKFSTHSIKRGGYAPLLETAWAAGTPSYDASTVRSVEQLPFHASTAADLRVLCQ